MDDLFFEIELKKKKKQYIINNLKERRDIALENVRKKKIL